MAKVIVELETADERCGFWRKTQQRFETQHGKCGAYLASTTVRSARLLPTAPAELHRAAGEGPGMS